MKDNTVSLVSWKTLIIDTIILLIMFLLPTISHHLSFPLYKLEPMRIMVLLGFLFSANKKNAFLLAVVLPIFSFSFGGHPVFIKSILMIIELIINIVLFDFFTKRNIKVFISMASAIVLSKLVYYCMKATFIYSGLLDMGLISTSILSQIAVTLFISVSFVLLYKKMISNRTENGR